MDSTPTTAGPAALQAYLDANGLNLNQFCKRSGIDYAQAHRILNGVRGKRVSIDFAAAIEDATGGAVAERLWCQETTGVHPVTPVPDAPASPRDSVTGAAV